MAWCPATATKEAARPADSASASSRRRRAGEVARYRRRRACASTELAFSAASGSGSGGRRRRGGSEDAATRASAKPSTAAWAAKASPVPGRPCRRPPAAPCRDSKDGRMAQPAHVDQEQPGQQRRPRGHQDDPRAAGRVHHAAVDVAESAEQVLVDLARRSRPRPHAHPVLQLGLVQQRPAAPAEAASKSRSARRQNPGRAEEVFITGQDELPIEAPHPDARVPDAACPAPSAPRKGRSRNW